MCDAMAMFSKYLASSSGALLHPLPAASGVLSPPFARLTLLKLSRLSTTISRNEKTTGYPEAEHTRTVTEFLLNECRMRQSELSAILNIRPSLAAVKSTHRARQAVQLLRDSGFTEDQVKKLITRNPTFLTYHADQHLKANIEFIKTLGLTAQAFRIVISNAPRLLTCSLEKTLCPNIQYLQNLFGSEATVSRVLKWVPTIVTQRNGPEIWGRKMKHLESFGFLEDEIRELIRREPAVLKVSTDKLQKNMDFFMHTAGLPAKFLLSYSKLVANYSLECRIKPRHKVLSALGAIQPSKPPPNYISALHITEQKFLEIYVHSSPHATKLLEIYRGKPALF